MVQLISHPIFELHETGDHCPENPARFSTMTDVHFSADELVEDIFCDQGVIQFITEGRILAASFHDSEYLEMLREITERFKYGPIQTENIDPDTVLGVHSLNVASYALGLVNHYANLVATEGKSYFLQIRPPGHHAHYAHSGGFCIFNNAALGAYTMLKQKKRVLILDIDAHLGDGTLDFVQHGFYKKDEFVRDPDNVCFISLQQEHLWKTEGESSEDQHVYIGNLAPGSSDLDYLTILKEEVEPLINEFKPDVAVVSAGFDTSDHDSESDLGKQMGLNLHLTKDTYTTIRRMISKIPALYILEGGYNPKSVEEGIAAICCNGTVK